MPTTKSKSSLPRGSSKNFSSSKAKTEGAIAAISQLVSAKESDDENTLIDIKVSNPLRKILELLKDIKRRQATTFSLKFTIPLIALPVFLLTAFELGRFKTACSPLRTTRIGTVRNLVVDVPVEEIGFIDSLITYLRNVPVVKGGGELTSEQRSILIDQHGNTLNILHSGYINLDTYENKKVLVTGNYSACTSVIILESENNIIGL